MYVVETMNMGYTFLSLGNLWVVGQKATGLNADKAIGCVVLRDLFYWCVAAHARKPPRCNWFDVFLHDKAL